MYRVSFALRAVFVQGQGLFYPCFSRLRAAVVTCLALTTDQRYFDPHTSCLSHPL